MTNRLKTTKFNSDRPLAPGGRDCKLFLTPPATPYQGTGSTEVGDVSWHVPTSGLSTVCLAFASPGHNCQNVAAIGSPIGHKGMMVAAKVLALSAIELLQDPQVLKDARADFQERIKDRTYTTKIPNGQKAPKAIR